MPVWHVKLAGQRPEIQPFEPVKPAGPVQPVSHFEKIEVANLQDSELESLEIAILESLKDSKSVYKSEEEIEYAYKQGEITFAQVKEQLELYNSKGNPSTCSYNSLNLKVNTDFLAEHYYNPILLTSEMNRQLFKHIIWVNSEVEFLKKLNENRDKLAK